jgi:hypothetical protein
MTSVSAEVRARRERRPLPQPSIPLLASPFLDLAQVPLAPQSFENGLRRSLVDGSPLDILAARSLICIIIATSC